MPRISGGKIENKAGKADVVSPYSENENFVWSKKKAILFKEESYMVRIKLKIIRTLAFMEW